MRSGEGVGGAERSGEGVCEVERSGEGVGAEGEEPGGRERGQTRGGRAVVDVGSGWLRVTLADADQVRRRRREGGEVPENTDRLGFGLRPSERQRRRRQRWWWWRVVLKPPPRPPPLPPALPLCHPPSTYAVVASKPFSSGAEATRPMTVDPPHELGSALQRFATDW